MALDHSLAADQEKILPPCAERFDEQAPHRRRVGAGMAAAVDGRAGAPLEGAD
jgi:hypothetical protein